MSESIEAVLIEKPKRFYVAFTFSTFIEADTEEHALKLAEKAMIENGYAVHIQAVS